jgi:hypothetical protein
MAKLNVQQIKEKARAIIRRNPGGIRFGALVDQIGATDPETPKNTIIGSVWNLDSIYPTEISKPSRGLFKPANVAGSDVPLTGDTVETVDGGETIRESDFYEPFAQWLKNDLDEVTDVVTLGGAVMRSKWGTPDVVGVYKPLAAQLIKFPLEIVSAEIKIDPLTPVVAFGQAVAYRLFSSKTYVVCRLNSRRKIKADWNRYVSYSASDWCCLI